MKGPLCTRPHENKGLMYGTSSVTTGLQPELLLRTFCSHTMSGPVLAAQYLLALWDPPDAGVLSAPGPACNMTVANQLVPAGWLERHDYPDCLPCVINACSTIVPPPLLQGNYSLFLQVRQCSRGAQATVAACCAVLAHLHNAVATALHKGNRVVTKRHSIDQYTACTRPSASIWSSPAAIARDHSP